MNLKKMLSAALALCMILCLCACGNTDDKNPPAGEDQSQNTPVTPSDDAANNDQQAPEDNASEDVPAGVVYTVTVTDEGGNPIAGAMVQLCQGELCLLPSATDANGVVSFTVQEEAAYEAKFLALPTGYDYVSEEHVFPFNGTLEQTIVLKAVA